MKKLFLTVLCLTFLVFAFSGSSSATLIGDTVSIGHYSGGTASAASGDVVVGSGIDFTYNASYLNWYTVDVEDYSITFDFLRPLAGYAGGAPFNGLLISGFDSAANGNGALTGVTVSTTLSGWDSSRLSFDNDSVSFNLLNLYAYDSDTFSATLSFGTAAVIGDIEIVTDPTPAMHNPIPAPILLLGTGLVGLAGFRRRIKK